jgi:hypothetical protein
VFYGGDNDTIGTQSGCQAGIDDIPEMGTNNWLMREISPYESDTMIDWSRFYSQVDVSAGMEPYAITLNWPL